QPRVSTDRCPRRRAPPGPDPGRRRAGARGEPTMNMAQFLHKAFHDPAFRTALETDQVRAEEWGVSDLDVLTAATLMRTTKGLPTEDLWKIIAALLRVDENAQPLDRAI